MSDDESPREVASIIWTAISGSVKIVAGLLGAYVNARWKVRRSKKAFHKSLVKHGLPEDYARELAATYAAAGHIDNAKNAAKEVLRINPHFSLDFFITTRPYKNQADRERLRDALTKAGLR